MLREYEKLTADFIKNINTGQEFKNKDNWDEALRYYRRSLDLNFLPGPDLFEEVSLRMGWINTVAKPGNKVTAQPTQS
ncbi:hypothetical protein FJZ33_07955 [Candidatus Poribacteria bacterium]|nr:hypothetical protein [Candidatus Poribacteria bacterium]